MCTKLTIYLKHCQELKPIKLTEPISLSAEFNAALNEMENSYNHLFITGRAGTGKSTLLNLFTSTTKKRAVVLAPTGIAALNVKGQTIHSFFRLPPKMIDKSDVGMRKNHRFYKRVDTIIIDEISMVRADMMDLIDHFLQVNREVAAPFGGVQMIFFGDLYQLPPIIANPVERELITARYESPYFFSAHVLQDSDSFDIIELHHVFRQEEKHFIRLLDNIRMREFDYDDMEDLNQRHLPVTEQQDFYITITTRNKIVNEINTKRINAIELPSFFYPAKIGGQFNEKIYPTAPILELKVGAQVMFIKNDPDKQFVNGSIGKVVHLDQDSIKVAIQTREEEIVYIDVVRLEWEMTKYALDEKNNKVVSENIGSFEQYPLKLAWAITVHKSQGQTFDRAIIDIGSGAFEYGQTYVALSRCRTLDGVILKRPIKPTDVIVDERVTEFYASRR